MDRPNRYRLLKQLTIRCLGELVAYQVYTAQVYYFLSLAKFKFRLSKANFFFVIQRNTELFSVAVFFRHETIYLLLKLALHNG